VEPPRPNEVQFQLSVGEGLDVTDEVQQAVERLLRSLLAEETEGYKAGCLPDCPDLRSCGAYRCLPLRNCQPLTKTPVCLADVKCYIQPR
jgi:hypothetical protein